MKPLIFFKILPAALIVFCLSGISANASDKDTVRAEDYFIEGVREYCAGEYSKAERMLNECLKTDSGNDAAWYYLAMISITGNNTDQALTYLDKASALSPENAWYRLMKARIYSSTGEPDPAISIYEGLIADEPGKSDYYYELADLFLIHNELDKALEVLDKIEQMKGVSEITSNARYEILMRQNKFDEAEKVVLKMDEDFPSPRTSLILGDTYKAKFDDSTALAYYRRALSMDPEFTPAYFGIAEICRMKRDFFNFFRNINIFLSNPQMNPQMKTSYLNEVVFASGMVQVFRPQVDTMVTNTLAAHPTDTSVMVLAGSYFAAVDSTGKGLDILRENMELHPDVKSARTAYMAQLFYAKQWDTLTPVAAKTAELFPEEPDLAEFLAIAYWQQGNIEKAIKTYENILRKLPEGDPMLINCYGSLGDLYHEDGNRRKAYSCYEKGLKIDDNYSPILNNYAYFLSQDGRHLSKALEMSRKTVLNEPDNATYLDTYGWLLYLTGNYDEAKKYLKKAMAYGGKENATILDHYAEVLFALKDYNLAFLYWGNAEKADPGLGIEEKVKEKREELNRK